MSDEVKRPRGRPAAIDWSTAGLGQEPDSEVAKRLGTARSTVVMARQRLGIPAYTPSPNLNARLEDLETRVTRLEARAVDESEPEPDPPL